MYNLSQASILAAKRAQMVLDNYDMLHLLWDAADVVADGLQTCILRLNQYLSEGGAWLNVKTSRDAFNSAVSSFKDLEVTHWEASIRYEKDYDAGPTGQGTIDSGWDVVPFSFESLDLSAGSDLLNRKIARILQKL